MGHIGSGGELEDRLHPSYGKAVISSGLPLPICTEERLQLWGESEVDLLRGRDSVSVQGLGEHNHELQVQEEQ